MRNIPQRRLLAFAILTPLLLNSLQTQAFRNSSKEPIKIGVFLDLSGQTSSFGQSTLNGIKLAADEVNRNGGLQGRQLSLIVEDDAGERAKVSAAVRRLVYEEKVNALIGEVASSLTLAAAPIAQEAEIPLVTPASTHPMVTTIGDYIFRACFIDQRQGNALAEFAHRDLKATRAAILTDSDSNYSKLLTSAFEKSFMELGGSVIRKEVYGQSDRDFTKQLLAIKSTRPHVLLVSGYYQEVGIIAKQARGLGIKTPLLGGDGWDSPLLWELGGHTLNGSYMTSHYSADIPTPSNIRFKASYQELYGMEPDAMSALGYDAMKILADAIRRAGGTEHLRLRDALASTKNHNGATGLISLDGRRNAVKPVYIMKLANRRFSYHTTVQPSP